MSGIRVERGSYADATGANISDNNGNGVEVDDDSHAVLDGANISGNAGDGVVVTGRSSVSVIEANIERNGVDGLYEALDVTRDEVPPGELFYLTEKAVSEKQKGEERGIIESTLMRTAATAGIAMADPTVAAISLLASLSLTTLEHCHRALRDETGGA